MFSKFKRNKIKTENPDRTPPSADPLSNKSPVGLPALKQKRMSERNEELQRRIKGSLNLSLNDFERTGIAASQNQMKFIGKPDGPCDHENVKAAAPEPKVEVDKISTSNTKKETGVSRTSSFQTDPHLNRGKDLPSVKSQRKASRDVNESVIALTPRERESILCLDNVLREHENFSFDASEDDDGVFRDEETGMELNNYAQVLDESSDSDSSMDSVIDLVGDLSTSCKTTRTIEPDYVSYNLPTPGGSNTPDSAIYETIPHLSNGKMSDRSESWKSSRQTSESSESVSEEHVYDVVEPAPKLSHSLPPPKDVVASEPVYSIVDRSKKLSSKRSQKPDLAKNEPVYSVVDKNRKTPKPNEQVDVVQCESTRKLKESEKSKTNEPTDKDVKSGATDDNPTAVSSRMYWVKMHESSPIAQPRQDISDIPRSNSNQRTIIPKRMELLEQLRKEQTLANQEKPLPDLNEVDDRESQNSPRKITENGVTRNTSKPRVMPKPKRPSRSSSSSSSNVASPTRQFVITPAYTKTLSFD